MVVPHASPGSCRSSISENAASNSAVERYASPASAYSTFIDGIRHARLQSLAWPCCAGPCAALAVLCLGWP